MANMVVGSPCHKTCFFSECCRGSAGAVCNGDGAHGLVPIQVACYFALGEPMGILGRRGLSPCLPVLESRSRKSFCTMKFAADMHVFW